VPNFFLSHNRLSNGSYIIADADGDGVMADDSVMTNSSEVYLFFCINKIVFPLYR
jgi:hypothetical protein